ncbi:hypothetical protein C5C74_09465 [Rathayibacter sp. AY1E8]|uniref:hypothetical protein n=1 Tax=Rathayibacter sp. AY1E8 TaxID=2080555 RepID=UPI000CE92A54|nr:hypothetical protein [Rathayibacter sp. AY1E8]PPG17959.1 hypothetical protein C5C74_09465 [Rathayibacter sp. AY1E8]
MSSTYRVEVSIGADGTIAVVPTEWTDGGSLDSVALPADGAELTINIVGERGAIRAEIDDPALASWWLAGLYGRAVARAVASRSAGLVEAREELVIDPTIGYLPDGAVSLADVVRRFALGAWLRRNWPGPVHEGSAEGTIDIEAIRPWLLDIELGVLAFEAEAVLGTTDVAASFLSPRVAEFDAHLAEYVVKQSDRQPPGGTGALLRSAASAALESLPTDSAHYDGIADSLERLQEMDSEVQHSADALARTDDASWFEIQFGAPPARAAVRPRHRSPALFAGVSDRTAVLGERLLASRSTDVDWRAVHPRQLSSAAGAIRWFLRAGDDGDEVVVRVRAAEPGVREPAEPGELVAQIDAAGTAFAVPLTLDAEGLYFVGSGPVEGGVELAAVSVHVRSDVFTRGDGISPDEARAFRATILRRILDRLATVAGPPDDGWRRPFAFERAIENQNDSEDRR